jgi:hypothetical protein
MDSRTLPFTIPKGKLFFLLIEPISSGKWAQRHHPNRTGHHQKVKKKSAGRSARFVEVMKRENTGKQNRESHDPEMSAATSYRSGFRKSLVFRKEDSEDPGL